MKSEIKMKVYDAIHNGWKIWGEDRPETLKWQIEEFIPAMDEMPSGSGFDFGVDINLDASDENSLVVDMPFHHMNEYGYYVGWSTVTLRATKTDAGIEIEAIENDIEASLECADEFLVKEHIDYCIDILRDCLEKEV